QLWIAAKTFPWRTQRCVAASILRQTRRGALSELGVGDAAIRQDRVWANVRCLAPDSVVWQHLVQPGAGDDPRQELGDVLNRALIAGAVSVVELELVRDLAIAADASGAPGGYGRGGLMAPAPSEAVAAQWGMHARTVRRRAR